MIYRDLAIRMVIFLSKLLIYQVGSPWFSQQAHHWNPLRAAAPTGPDQLPTFSSTAGTCSGGRELRLENTGVSPWMAKQKKGFLDLVFAIKIHQIHWHIID